jgi:glycosyltransferase involved in cell wall biosynthesis
MAKILYCGDAFVETGFGRVAEYLLPALAEEHEVSVLAVNHHGDPHPETKKYNVYPAMLYGSDPFGSHRIANIVQTVKPDLIWVTNDIWIALQLWEQVKGLKEQLGFKWFVYTPIDSYGLFPELAAPMMEWDGVATYTEFAKKELELMGYTKPINVIGHGTDFTKFFPLDRDECRQKLGVPKDAFVVFNGNRNQPRKRIDLTIKAFIKFAKDKDDARLWLNMGSKDLGWELVPLFKRVARDEGYDPTGKLILTSPYFSVDNCLPIEQLNQVYNTADIGINTCIGEGWGLVNSEHGSTGVMQVVPDHTSLAEIFDEVPRIVCNASETDRNYGLERMLPDPDSAASILSYYYENRDLLKKDGQWCQKRLREEPFTWPYIQKQFKDAVNSTLNAKPATPEFKGFGTPAKIA